MNRFLAPLLLVTALFVSGCGMFGSEEPAAPAKVIEVGQVGLFDGDYFLQETTTVPGRVGTTFGFGFRILSSKNGKDMAVRIITKNPGMPDAVTGKLSYVQEAGEVLDIGKYFQCTFTFEKPSDIVPGTWVLEVVGENGDKASRTFTVTEAPAAVPQGAGPAMKAPVPAKKK